MPESLEEAPPTPTQPHEGATAAALTGIWMDVLRLPAIAPDANFFDISGDSMKAMEVITRTAVVLGVDLPLMAFFEDPTIAHLAEVVNGLRGPASGSAATVSAIWSDVLRVPAIAPDANFFDIGGDSMKAMEVITRVSEALHVELPLMAFFEGPTVAHLAAVIDELLGTSAGISSAAIVHDPARRDFPLAHSQQVFWLLSQQVHGTGLYNTARIFRMRGPIEAGVLERSLNELRRRHLILQVRFVAREGGPHQIIDAGEPLALQVTDLTPLSEIDAEAAALQLALETVREPFDLAAGPVLRAHFVRITAQDSLLCIAIHHVVSDGFTGNILLEELAAIYDAFIVDQPTPLPELALHFTDYAAWERDWMSGPRLDDELAYWKNALRGVPPSIDLPADRERTLDSGRHGHLRSVMLPATELQKLQSLAQSNGTTLFTVLSAGLRAMLSLWSGQADFIIGTIASNRSRASTERMVGCFVNPLALRNPVAEGERVLDLIAREKSAVMEAFSHQDCPFARIVEAINPERTRTDNPLFNTALLLQSFPTIAVEGRSFHARDINFDAQVALLDIRFIATETADGLQVDSEYSTELFDAATVDDLLVTYLSVLTQMAEVPTAPVNSLRLSDSLARTAETHRRARHRETLAIAANFTAEPIEEPLAFWMKQLRIPTQIEFAPFDQVFQQLLDPSSLVGANADGVNLILIQWRAVPAPESQARELAQALKVAAARHRAPILVCICPPAVSSAEEVLRIELAGQSGIHVLYPQQIQDLYPVENFRDQFADSVGMIPYTPEFFVAAASLAARRLFALRASMVKVIALDCDNTLWKGVCGEDGPLGVQVDAPRKALQQFMLEQRDAGVLLCLCSKNVAEDVDAVFDKNPGMLLRREDFVASRINWEPKSGNLHELATELRLGIDSFAFVDDNPIECAEVRANCPAALVLELPEDDNAIPVRLRHMWAFDHWSATKEDRQRSLLYQQEQQREQTRAEAPDLAAFLKSLQLRIDIRSLEPDDLGRVAQLTQRTNQFNVSTLRRSDDQLAAALESGFECFVVDVSDRFGEYGLVGAVILAPQGSEALVVDTLLLSCRALGRRVEHHLLAHIGALALQRGLSHVDILFVPTARNRPVLDFLQSLDARVVPSANGTLFRFAADYASIVDTLTTVAAAEPAEQIVSEVEAKAPAAPSADLEGIAATLATVPSITRAIQLQYEKGVTSGSALTLRSATQEILAGIWTGLLHITPELNDDFFRLGGNSLLAVQVLSRVRQILAVEMPLRAMFEDPTLATFAQRIDSARRDHAGFVAPSLEAVSHVGPMPASFAQQRLWFIDQLEPGNPIYNIPQMIRLRGPLNISALERSFAEIVRRHESLRTTFAAPEGSPRQIVGPPAPVPLPFTDLSHMPEPIRDAEIHRLALQEATLPFQLDSGLMLRARLLLRATDEHILLIVLHHISGDRWSAGILAEEMEILYAAYVRGEPSPLPDLPIQYADFALWQRSWLEGDELTRQAAYWRNQLAGAPAVLEFPTDRPRPAVLSHKGSTEIMLLPQELVAQLTALSQGEGVTLFMTLLAALQTLLAKYSGSEDIVVGSPIAGRNHTQVEPLIGFFVNTLALRGDLSGDPTFRDLLQRVRGVALDAYAHQDIPFERLVEDIQPERSLSYQPIFQIIFALQNAPQRSLELAGLTLERLPLHQGTSAFDMSWFATHLTDGMQIRIEYNTDLFEAATIRRALGHYRNLVEAIVANPERRLSELELMDEEEHHQVLKEFNDTTADYPRDLCIQDLVAQQVHKTPDAVALVDGDQRVSYRELNARANQVAHYLIERGAGPDIPVGICAERSIALLVGILGILKSGSPYVPLDPAYPIERLQAILEDAQAPLVLTQKSLDRLLHNFAGKTIYLDDDRESIERAPNSDPVSSAGPRNLAYILFTSGSTGRPKGVAIEHRTPATFIQWAKEIFSAEELAGVLFSTSICFDVSMFEMFVTLSAGGKVIIAENALMLPTLPAHNEVTMINAVPSVMAELEGGGGIPASAMTLNLAGEALPDALVERLCALPSVQRVFNLYGPTETSYTTFTRVMSGRPVTIGKPVANTQCYVLDANKKPAAIGVAGELYIAGDGVARGYYGRPEMTAERFVPNPFSKDPNARMYRTGDRCRWLMKGELQYFGRLDQQIKLRGFRIELGEIEATLDRHGGVERSVAMVREDEPGMPRLIAYVTLNQLSGVTAEILQQHVRQSLPDFMTPSAIVLMEAFPLTTNGKIDRKALPAPDHAAARDEYVAPQTETEQNLARIWAEVLRTERVGITDNFFALGGHSLLATQVVARIRRDMNTEVPLRSIFEWPTIEEFAKQIAATADSTRQAHIPRVSRDQPLPLSSAQERLWFLNQLEPDNGQYNFPMSIRLAGVVDVEALRAAVNGVIRRHEVLRTSFRLRHDRPIQVIADELTVDLPVDDISDTPAEQREEHARRLVINEGRRPFRLETGPLIRALLLRLDEQDHILLLNIHHAATDGWSMGPLVDELAALYAAAQTGDSSPLPELPIQYADYAVWQKRWLESGALQEQLAYWKEQLAGAPARIELPTDRPRPAMQSFRGGVESVFYSKQLLQRLKTLGQTEGATLYMTLLAALQVLLYRYTAQENIVVGTPVANRSHTEVEGLIGIFVNTIAMHTNLSGNPSFSELLQRVSKVSLDAFAHQYLPFEELVKAVAPDRDLSANPVVQVLFVLQNARRAIVQQAGVEFKSISIHNETSKLDIGMFLIERPEGLQCMVEYAEALFDPATIRRMLGHFGVLLQAIVEDPGRHIDELPLLIATVPVPETKIATLPLLPETERELLLFGWNDTFADYPRDRCLHDLLSAHAVEHAERTALRFGDVRVSYRELERKTNQLAHHLRASGTGRGDRVGVYLERSIDLLVALIAVIKTGAAYVPLDPRYPPGRIAMIVEDAEVSCLLTSSALRSALPEYAGVAIAVDTEAEVIAGRPDQPIASGAVPSDLLYVIFTSGSTGRPKGVEISHGAAVNLLTSMARTLSLGPDDVFLALTSAGFDISVAEFFLPLLTGGTVAIAESHHATNGEELAALLQRYGVTAVQATPTTWNLLLDAGYSGAGVKRSVGGEGLPVYLFERLMQAAPGTPLWNWYGPTETTIWSTVAMFLQPEDRLTVGRPIANTQVYVLDRNRQLCPVGVPGEIHIAGDGVARGYRGRAELTAAVFLPDPFSSVPGARMYKTADLGRWLADGTIEHLGRIDHQVKLRGHRIELGEIEAALAKAPGIREAVCAVREDSPGDKRLVAYLVADREPDPAELRRTLKETLPDYMLPSTYVRLERLPLTPNGKIDRLHLPAPTNAPERSRVDVPGTDIPGTAVQQIVAAIWADLLKLENIQLEDDFFELGGHSLLATQCLARLRKALDIEISLRTLFEHRALEAFAAQVEEARSGPSPRIPEIVRIERGGILEPSFAQLRLWFVHQLDLQSTAYNMPSTIRLKGVLHVSALEQALSQVVERHETLRTVFGLHHDQPVQVILPHAPIHLPLVDLLATPELGRMAAAQALAAEEAALPFDFAIGPMFRFKLVRLAPDDHMLILVLHHINTDGWSYGILHAELSELYAAALEDRQPNLPALEIHYADFAAWQHLLLSGDGLTRQLEFWRTSLAGAPQVLQLPADHPRPADDATNAWAAFHTEHLTSETTAQVAAFARQHAVTPFMVLLSVYEWLLAQLSGQHDLVLGTDLAGRTTVETERLIGFFINVLPIRARIAAAQPFSEFLGENRNHLLDVFAHQDMPFDKLVQEFSPERSNAHNPLVQVLFVLENAPRNPLQLPGLEVSTLPSRSRARFDLSLFVTLGEAIKLSWMYNTELFEPATVARFSALYRELLAVVLGQPEITFVAAAERLAAAEQAALEAAQQEAKKASTDRLKNTRRRSISS